jgi:hypothetical protein
MQDAKKPNAAVIAIIIIVLVGAVAAGTIYVLKSRETSESSTMQTSASQMSESGSDKEMPMAASMYKSGTYMATGGYLSPGGQESVDVEVTLSGDTITAATVTPHAATSTSTQYQGEFVANFKALVVGKDIDEVKLSRVAGSSLTSGGFNEALDKIKLEAAA